MFDGQFDIANKALCQCYLMDEEMFVGEQRFIEEDTRKFMEYYRQKIAEEEGEIYEDETSKGLTAKIAAVDKLNEEENQNLDEEEEEESEEEEEEEEEKAEEEEKKDLEQPKKDGSGTDRVTTEGKKKTETAVDSEEEEDEDEEDEDEEDEEEEEDEDEEEEDEEEEEGDEEEDEEEEEEEEEDEEEEEEEEEDEEEEEEEEEPAPKKKSERPAAREEKSISSRPLSGQSLKSMDIQIQNLSHRTGGGNFQGDAPSIFNRSRVANSTLKNYDEDEDEGQYRL